MSEAVELEQDDDSRPLIAIEPDDITDELWERGELAWKLDPHQQRVYELFVAWNKHRQTAEYSALVEQADASLDDVWVEEIARRWGKTAKWIVTLVGLCIQRKGAVFTYATAYQKDIGDIIVPLAAELLADGPDSVRPRYQRSKNEGHEGLYFPPSVGSVIKLVGVDQHPDALRGRFSDGVVISEAGFVRKLQNTVRAVLLPQFQRRPWAFLALESSTPEEIDHDFCRVFVPDAKKRAAYVMRTIDDNEAIDPREKEKAIRQAGGRGHPTCEREYYCVQVRDPERVLIPEFDEAVHVVKPGALPTHACAYEAMDPGLRDKFGVAWGFWDFERAKLVIQKSWAGSGLEAGTPQVADLIRKNEQELWSTLLFWNGKKLCTNPFLRVSDIDARFLQDMATEHGISIVPTAKDDAEAQLYSLRRAFADNKIEIWSDDPGPLAGQCKAARWNDSRTDWERSDVHGHFDCVAALIYLWRNVVRTMNPFPPGYVGKSEQVYQISRFAKLPKMTQAARALAGVFSGNRFRPRNRRAADR